MGGGISKDLPFKIGLSTNYKRNGWALYEGNNKQNKLDVSVFQFNIQQNRSLMERAKKCFLGLKTTRHPDILAFLDGVELDDSLYMVTESVVPLQNVLKNLSTEERAWGLYTIIRSINFLNEKTNAIHGDALIDNIFVTKSGEWKLGLFDHYVKVESGNNEIKKALIASKYKCPEIVGGKWAQIVNNSISAIDSWGVGLLSLQVFNGVNCLEGVNLNSKNSMKHLFSNLPNRKFTNCILRCFAKIPNSRVNSTEILGNEYFKENKLIQIFTFLETISTKTEKECEIFFKSVTKSVLKLPEKLLKLTILPQLLKSIQMGTTKVSTLNLLLKIGKILTQEEFQKMVWPVANKLFTSLDRTIRICLLENLSSYIELISGRDVNNVVFPNIVNGFTDSSPQLRDTTVKSMVTMVPKLEEKKINSVLLKYLAKLQLDPESGIRTNTTICLGNIAKYLNPKTRSKILIPGLSRALRDPFDPTKLFALRALSQTRKMFTIIQIATTLIPRISPLTVCGNKDVREESLKTIRSFLDLIEKESKKIETKSSTNQMNQPQNKSQNSIHQKLTQKIIQNKKPNDSNENSMIGWVVKKFNKKETEQDSKINNNNNNNNNNKINNNTEHKDQIVNKKNNEKRSIKKNDKNNLQNKKNQKGLNLKSVLEDKYSPKTQKKIKTIETNFGDWGQGGYNDGIENNDNDDDDDDDDWFKDIGLSENTSKDNNKNKNKHVKKSSTFTTTKKTNSKSLNLGSKNKTKSNNNAIRNQSRKTNYKINKSVETDKKKQEDKKENGWDDFDFDEMFQDNKKKKTSRTKNK
ncbi:n-terminal kinase-like protein [Anaeramoeba flamelloides]|uniref:N-terminal kinase-like protein n=1 Tax=Anaeramoeba flamelloides TaxID=1746091 RepID=A0AAV8A4Y0_9EUKA|nr:n-terminal kinase-like protein [Anaeramoeba flamelloides]